MSVGVPRLVALVVINLAVSDSPTADLTRSYSYGLTASFQPQDDYRAGIRAIAAPAEVIVGQDDEIFLADKFRPLFDEAGRKDIRVTRVPTTGHLKFDTSKT